ncbi:hypothetical protein acdb102_40730 [Acidothermaceae bacterium B102]|nr:hypothetical protein acdb102_40730 [Acidothermaceae bacterium B102]
MLRLGPVITTTFEDFFLGSAGAAAALIGLLFVAVSIAADRPRSTTAETGMQLRASAALLCFVNVMITSLLALMPRTNVGYPATIVGGIGLLFTLASATVMIRSWHERQRGTLSLVVGFSLLFGFEVYYGVDTLRHPHLTGAITGVATVMVASLSVGVSRAWEIVGLPDTGVVASVRLIVGLGQGRHAEKPGGPPETLMGRTDDAD